MIARTDLHRFGWLLRRYLAPHWRAVALLILSSFLATAMAGFLPVLMAPILDLALGAPMGAAAAPESAGAGGLSLRNPGATVFQWFGIQTVDDRFRTVVYLFNSTIRDNIAYGREGLTEADVVRAARIANAHDPASRARGREGGT